MNKIIRAGSPAHVGLAMVGLVTLVTHWSLIWHHAVPDFDTDAIVGQAADVCGNPWIVKGMGDSAHPLGNALLQQYVCLWHESGVLATAQGWSLLLGAAVTIVALLLVLGARITGGGAAAAAIALGYLGVSPVLRTLSMRAEEDWIGLTLFLVTTVLVLAFHRARNRLRSWLLAIALSTVVLSVWHSQYLLVLAFGLVPWGVVALVRPGLAGTTRPRVLMLGAAMAIPSGAVLGALFGSGYAVRVEYHKLFFSIFNPAYWEGIGAWSRNYASYSSRWLTGWLGNDGMDEKLFAAPTAWPFVVLGVVALTILVLVVAATRNSVLIAVAFGCLLLPFLFEPHNAERWDPTAAIVALALAGGAWGRPRPQQDDDEELVAEDRTTESGAPTAAQESVLVR